MRRNGKTPDGPKGTATIIERDTLHQALVSSRSSESVRPMDHGKAEESGQQTTNTSHAAAVKKEPAELHKRLLVPLLRYIEDTGGTTAMQEIAEAAGLEEQILLGTQTWLSWRQFEAILAAGRKRMASDEEFVRASQYLHRDGYGIQSLMIRATSIAAVFRLAALTMHMVSKISRYEFQSSTRNSVRTRYLSDRPESRLMCLSRQAQITNLPVLCGLPAAKLVETACLARGDPYCEYVVSWNYRPRWQTVLLGALGGALAAAPLAVLVTGHPLAPLIALPLLGGTLAYALELRSTNAANLRFEEEGGQRLREVTEAHAEAIEELLGLHARQKYWSRMLEEQEENRGEQMQAVVRQLQELRETQATTVRGYSHDLRNPLLVLRWSADQLREVLGETPEPVEEVLSEIEDAARRMDQTLAELVKTVNADQHGVQPEYVTMETEVLAEQFSRRLRALVFPREIRVSVFRTREAPVVVETNPLVFDRVVDNLLTNASKYTEHGSIVVEIGGTPGTLAIKVSDTGPGISDDHIEQIFHPRPPSSGGGEDHHGMGLSIVARLLHGIGGRLEVMSRTGVGSTFWAHFPAQPARRPSTSRPSGDDIEGIIDRVVTIRRIADHDG